MARLIESVVGHQPEIEKLLHMKNVDRWPHAMIFAGPSGTGKKKIALSFAQMLICEQAKTACGVCGPCLRIEKEQSESLLILAPEAKAVKEVIKVEAVRSLLDSLSLASIGKSRVVIIDQAHLMNPQASNALLKTLEEPFDNVYFILIGEDIQQFMPTIRSRSQVLRFQALTTEQVKKIKPNLPEWAYLSCRGQIDKLTLLTSTEGQQKREDALTLFEQFCEDEQFLLSQEWRSQIKERSWAQFSTGCWLQIVRDLLVLKSQAQKFILNTDQVERLKKFYSVPSKKLLKLADELVKAERDLLANAEPVLVFENLWVSYARS